MNIPQSVKVAGINYTVEETEYVEIHHDKNYSGSCDYVKAEIKILKDMDIQRKEETFIHELTHAIFHEAGYNEHEEEMVNKVSKVLYQVLKDNNIGEGKYKL
jgi:Zn-dependent peptidase ImmA (M78 family)